MKHNLRNWLQDSKYLPEFLQDFHDQKDVFKLIHSECDIENNEYTKDISWVSGHVYVIDLFLWYMAKCGYTLQKSRKKLDFYDINQEIKENRQSRINSFSAMITNAKQDS